MIFNHYTAALDADVPPTMDFLLNRRERLAEYLREQIHEGQITEPLPNTRDWARALGVSCPTLSGALQLLAKEDLVTLHPRQGVRLHGGQKRPSGRTGRRAVRLVYRAADFPAGPTTTRWVVLLSQFLQNNGIHFRIEGCTDARLRALVNLARPAEADRRELLLLLSLPARYQRLFDRSRRSALVVGYPAQGVTLPFVTSDYDGAIQHATHRLLRRGFSRLCLIINKETSVGIHHACHAFNSACSSWPHQPVRAETLHIPLEPCAQLSALNRFAARLRDPCGIILAGPVNVGAIMTCLYAHGVAISTQAELVTIDNSSSSILVWPMPTQYTVSMQALSRVVANAVVHFFETGTVPAIQKTVWMKMIPPG